MDAPVHACLACLEHVAHDARDHDLDQRRECLLSNIYVLMKQMSI